MEGPTTVSALIHAATMVAAGVYLLAITSVFLGFTPTDQLAIVAVGGFTTFFAATMAVVHPDIKRVIAYSTISQLGYMVLAIGAGFAMVGLYHLFTHAFFKALLFLAAGSIIHAIGTQDLFKMGGLKKPMRLTAAAFAIGGLALAGIPPFAGFWSKDDILSAVYSQVGSHPLYWPFFLLAFAAVFLTAYYIFRAWFLAFSGDRPRDPTLPTAHEGPWVMQAPLAILSAFAVVAGLFVFFPGFQHLLLGGAGVAGIPPSFGTTDVLLSSLSVGLGLGGSASPGQCGGTGGCSLSPKRAPSSRSAGSSSTGITSRSRTTGSGSARSTRSRGRPTSMTALSSTGRSTVSSGCSPLRATASAPSSRASSRTTPRTWSRASSHSSSSS